MKNDFYEQLNNRNDSVLIFISQWDRSGDPILISLALNKKLGEVNVHKITSIYGKEKISVMLNNLYKEKRILKCSDNAWRWMKAIGVDIPIDANFISEDENDYYSKYIVVSFI